MPSGNTSLCLRRHARGIASRHMLKLLLTVPELTRPDRHQPLLLMNLRSVPKRSPKVLKAFGGGENQYARGGFSSASQRTFSDRSRITDKFIRRRVDAVRDAASRYSSIDVSTTPSDEFAIRPEAISESAKGNDRKPGIKLLNEKGCLSESNSLQ